MKKSEEDDKQRETKSDVAAFSPPAEVKKVLADAASQTKFVSKTKLSKPPTAEMEVQTDPVETEEIDKTRSPFHNKTNTDVFSSSMISDDAMDAHSKFEDAVTDIYSNDVNELDVSREREDFLNFIQTNLSRKSDVDLKDLEFDHIDDVNKPFISVTDKINNEHLNVPKSKILFEKQQDELKKVPAKRRKEVEVLQSAISHNPFPPSTFQRKTKTSAQSTGSGLAKLPKTWITYESYFESLK